mmetsp:Transcript_41653/g.114742  ORF Transcript_41653/g.114742 Transcript_41653/m.114742 type:complete len:238 (+) Transcript_41653:413-1126(+)
MRRQRREVARDHVVHPVLRHLAHLDHVELRLDVVARRALLDELHEQLGLVEEVDLGQLLGVVDADLAVGVERRLDQRRQHLELLLRVRHARKVVLVLDVDAEALLGEGQRLAEHVLDHVRDVGRLLEEARPVERRPLRDVALEQRLHRALAELVARDRLHRVDAVLSDLGEKRELDAVEEVDLVGGALIELLEDGQQELLLVLVALKLLEHLARAPRDVGAVILRAGGADVEPEQEV